MTSKKKWVNKTKNPVGEMYPEAQKIANIKELSSYDRQFRKRVSDGRRDWCQRCHKIIDEGVTFTYIYRRGGYHIGSCPKTTTRSQC